MKKLTVLVVILLVAGLLAGCWLFPGSKLDYIETNPNDVTLNTESAMGGTQSLTVTAFYEDLTIADVTLKCEYISSDPEIAIVDIVNDEVLIKAIYKGEAEILVTYTQHNAWTGRIIRTCEVNVTVEY